MTTPINQSELERAAKDASKEIYDKIESIQSEALYRGTVEQSGEAVEFEFIQQVSAIIKSHLATLQKPVESGDKERIDALEAFLFKVDSKFQFFDLRTGPMVNQITLVMYNGTRTKVHTSTTLREAIDKAMSANHTNPEERKVK